jgi:hypothetical protein
MKSQWAQLLWNFEIAAGTDARTMAAYAAKQEETAPVAGTSSQVSCTSVKWTDTSDPHGKSEHSRIRRFHTSQLPKLQ